MSDIVNETLNDMNLSSDALQRYSDQTQRNIPELHGEDQVNMGTHGTINIQDLSPQDQISYMRQLAFDNNQAANEENTEEISVNSTNESENIPPPKQEPVVVEKFDNSNMRLIKLTIGVIIICFIIINPVFILNFNRIIAYIFINYLKLSFNVGIANILRSILCGTLFYLLYLFI